MPTGTYELTGAASQTTPAFRKSSVSVTGGRVNVLRIKSQVTITFDANGGYYVYPSQRTYAAGMTYGTLPTAYRTGYSCTYWTNSIGSYVSSYSYVPENNTTLYARWYANTYLVTLDRAAGSGGTSSTYATFDSDMPTITIPAKDGYLFGGYYTGQNGSGTQYYSAKGVSSRKYTLAYDTTLYAKWTKWETTADINDVGSGIKLTWTATPSASTYTIWRSATNSRENASMIAAVSSTTRTYTDSSAMPGKQYWYWIEAKDTAGASICSSAISAIRHISVAGNVTAQCGASTNSILITWSAVQGASYYQVFRENSCCSQEDGIVPIATTTATRYLDTNVAPGFEYSYWIVAKTADDTSASELVEGFVRYPVPVIDEIQLFNVRRETESRHHVLVSWDTFPIDDFACVLPAYRLWRADSPDGERTLVCHLSPDDYYWDLSDEWDTGEDVAWDDEEEDWEEDIVELELLVTETEAGKVFSITVWDNGDKAAGSNYWYYLETVPEWFDPETESYDEDFEIYRMMESGLSEPASVFISPTTTELSALLANDLREKGCEFASVACSGPVSARFDNNGIEAVRLDSYPGSTSTDWGNGRRGELSLTTTGNGRLVCDRNVDGITPLQLYLDGELLDELYDTGGDWSTLTNDVTDDGTHVWTFRFEKNDEAYDEFEDDPDWLDEGMPYNCALLKVVSWQSIPAVTFRPGDHGTLQGDGSRLWIPGEIEAPEVSVSTGYRFTGWDGAWDSVTTNLTVTAQYVKTWNVVFVPGTYGTIASGDRKQTVDEGSDAIPPEIEAKPNWRFTGWNNTYTNVTSGRIVRAQYVETRNVTFDIGENGVLVIGVTNQAVDVGGRAIAPDVEAKKGYRFTGWDTSFETITEHTTVTAQYVKTWNVVFVPGTYGTIASGDRKQTVDEGSDAVPPEIEANANWRFAGWDKPYTNITSGRIVRALYRQTVSVRFDCGESASLSDSQSPDGGTGIYDVGYAFGSLPVASHPDYRFAGWETQSGTLVDESTLAGAGDTVLRAIWSTRGDGDPSDPIPSGDLIPVSQLADQNTSCTPIAVPFSWLRDKLVVASSIVADAAMESPRYYLRQDFEQAAMNLTGKRDASGRELRVWQDYLAGTDPNDPTDQFKITSVSPDGNGIRFRWYPDLGSERRYVIYGKRNLTDPEWATPTNSAHRFFKIEVNMP